MNEENNKVFASADYCRKLKADIAELEEKHWNECRQIVHYDDELRQLATENTELKRLLRAAVEDMRYLESHTVDEEGSCLINEKGELINCKDCPLNNNSKVSETCCKWNYEDEALKLIGDENDAK